MDYIDFEKGNQTIEIDHEEMTFLQLKMLENKATLRHSIFEWRLAIAMSKVVPYNEYMKI